VAARLLHTPPPLTHALPQENLGKQGVCNGFIHSSFSRRRWPANKKKHKQSSGSFSFFQMCFLIFFFQICFTANLSLVYVSISFASGGRCMTKGLLATGHLTRRCRWMGTCSVLSGEGEREGISSGWRVSGSLCGCAAGEGSTDLSLWAPPCSGC